VANFGLDEVLGQLRRNGENRAIGHGGDFTDQAVIVADKPEVLGQRGKGVPPGKGLRVHHDATQPAVFLDVGVNDRGERREITRPQGTLRPKDHDSLVPQQLMGEHAGTSSMSFRAFQTVHRTPALLQLENTDCRLDLPSSQMVLSAPHSGDLCRAFNLSGGRSIPSGKLRRSPKR